MHYKVLLVGLGAVGLGYDFKLPDTAVMLSHAKSLANHKNFKIVGGVDVNSVACIKFSERYNAWAGSDLIEALTMHAPDVVVVSTPTEVHKHTLDLVLKHAKPKLVLCEKPLSYSFDEAESMVANCHAAGCMLYVNYPRRVEPGVLEIKKRLTDGIIRTPIKGTAWYTKGLLHNGSHFVNLIEFWLGPVVSFRVIQSRSDSTSPDICPDFQVIFRDGEVTFLYARHDHFTYHNITLLGANGCLRYEDGGEKIIWHESIKNPNLVGYKRLEDRGEVIPNEGFRAQWHVADNMIKCLSRKTSYLCSGADALATLKTINEIRHAL